MAYCPFCHREYPPGSRCPDHGALIQPLRTEDISMDREDRMVRACVVWSETMGLSWAEMLRNNGIPAVVKVGGPGFSLGGPPPFGYETYVYVPERLLDRARAILEGFEDPGRLEVVESDVVDE